MSIIPAQPQTMIGIGVHLYGRKVMYVITLMIFVNQISLNICYLIVLGKTLVSFSNDIFGAHPDSIFSNRKFYVVTITLI